MPHVLVKRPLHLSLVLVQVLLISCASPSARSGPSASQTGPRGGGADGSDAAPAVPANSATVVRESDGPTNYIPEDSPYLSTTEIYALLDQHVRRHPSLAELIDYGDSYNKSQDLDVGYDLKALRITNRDISGEKPTFFLVGGYHGNELAGPEVAVRFMNWLLDGYGSNPDATWIVDHHEVWVVPTANPDGRGFARVNANGVDLNRNHTFKWQENGTRHGSGPASEPEIAGIEALLGRAFRDQRGPGDSDRAPDTTTGNFVTLHTPFRQNLFPWSFTDERAPNFEGLRAIAEKVSATNGYEPGQGNRAMYQMLGAATDHAYGTFGVPALLIEIGPTHTPPFEIVDRDAWPDHKDPLIWMAKISKAPYRTALGPDVLDVQHVYDGNTLRFSATVDDFDNGADAVAGAEFSVDAPMELSDVEVTPMESEDGAFDERSEVVFGELDLSSLSEGRHTLYVRGRDATGNAGVISARFFEVDHTVTPIIIDNDDPGTSRSGGWANSAGSHPWGGRSLKSGLKGTFRWTPEIQTAGRYEVFEWHTHENTRHNEIPYRIAHAGGVATVMADHYAVSTAGQWNSLGTFTFEEGDRGFIEVVGFREEEGERRMRDGTVRTFTRDVSFEASADAIKLVYRGR